MYNGSGYNGAEGDIMALIRIRHNSDGTLQPFWQLWTCDDSACNSATTIVKENFNSCNVQLDTPVTLSLYKQGTTLIFKCNEDQASYTLSGSLYAPSVEERRFRTRVYSTSGQSGYFKTTFDDVYTQKSFPWTSFLPAIMESKNK